MVDTRSSKKSSNSDTVAASPGQKVKPVKAEKRQDKRRVPKPRKYWAGTKTQPGASCNCRPCQKAGWIMGHPRCANRPCNGKKPCNNCKKQKRIDQCRYAERYSQEERIAGDKDTRGTAASMEDTNASPFTTEPEDSYTASLVPMASGSTLGNEAGADCHALPSREHPASLGAPEHTGSCGVNHEQLWNDATRAGYHQGYKQGLFDGRMGMLHGARPFNSREDPTDPQ